MSWSFEVSLLAFLVIAFASQGLAVATRGRLSLPLALGVICAAGFALGLLPTDLASKSRMRDVGFIAFNVLVVHSGTLVDPKAARSRKGAALTGLACLAALVVVLGLGLAPVLGREAALFSIGPAVGGGAACAIASNAALRRLPGIAALPWIIFMFQGFFGLPLLALSLRKEVARLAPRLSARLRSVSGSELGSTLGSSLGGGADRSGDEGSSPRRLSRPPLCERLPAPFRGPAFYLASLMLVAVLNRVLYGAFLARLGPHPALSALVLGFVFARLGLLARDPLSKADSMGILMLGLMALMADALAAAPPGALLGLAPLALIALAAAALVAAGVGALAGRLSGAGAWRGMVAAASCMIGLPPAVVAARGILRGLEPDDARRAALEAELLPDIDVASTVVTNVAAIAVAGLVGIFA